MTSAAAGNGHRAAAFARPPMPMNVSFRSIDALWTWPYIVSSSRASSSSVRVVSTQ
jgi:hypothetical protein